MNRVDECVMEEVGKWWQRRKELVYGGSPHELGPLAITPKLAPPKTINTHDMVDISVNRPVCI